jgi:hypothetical protein
VAKVSRTSIKASEGEGEGEGRTVRVHEHGLAPRMSCVRRLITARTFWCCAYLLVPVTSW